MLEHRLLMGMRLLRYSALRQIGHIFCVACFLSVRIQALLLQRGSIAKVDLNEIRTMDRLQEAKRFRQRIFERHPALKEHGECPAPNQRFWDFYHEQKQAFWDACIGVRNTDAGWMIVAYDLVDRQAEADREIQEMLARHQSECRNCQTPCVIEKHIMRNGYPNYRFFCKSCRERTSSSLPHTLVDYLHSHKQVEIRDRF